MIYNDCDPQAVLKQFEREITAISKQEVSAPISCWVTFDPAESPILPGQKMLCTYVSEYNP